LSLLPAGRQIDTATELLASEHMLQVAKQLGSSHGRRVVLFDSPPLLMSTESRAMLGAIGQVVLVVRAEITSQQAVRDAIEAVGDKPISLILNQSSSALSPGYYGYGTYGDTASQANAER
jgi:Mrp family chromosome partitioning ATPase